MTTAAHRLLPVQQLLPAIVGVYITQSMISAIIFLGLPAVLRNAGVGLDKISLLYLLMLPWALKFLWASVVERYRLPLDGKRRSRQLIVFGQMLVVACVLVLSTLDPSTGLHQLMWVLVVVTLITATIDIACDGFAIEQLKLNDRSWGNVMQVGGGYLGMMMGGGLFLIVVDHYGWQVATLLMVITIAVLTIPMYLLKEPSTIIEPSQQHTPSLISALRRPEIRWGIATVIVFQLGLRFSLSLMSPFLVDRGFDLALIGWVSGVGGTVTSLIGILFAGIVVRRCGASRVLGWLIKIQLIVFFGFIAVAWLADLPRWTVVLLLITHSLVTGACFVALYTAMMNWSSHYQAGVDFTLFQSTDAVLMVLAGFGSNLLSHHIGYDYSFILGAVLVAFACVLLPGLLKKFPCIHGDSEKEKAYQVA